jgi:hypothetical protein
MSRPACRYTGRRKGPLIRGKADSEAHSFRRSLPCGHPGEPGPQLGREGHRSVEVDQVPCLVDTRDRGAGYCGGEPLSGGHRDPRILRTPQHSYRDADAVQQDLVLGEVPLVVRGDLVVEGRLAVIDENGSATQLTSKEKKELVELATSSSPWSTSGLRPPESTEDHARELAFPESTCSQK